MCQQPWEKPLLLEILLICCQYLFHKKYQNALLAMSVVLANHSVLHALHVAAEFFFFLNQNKSKFFIKTKSLLKCSRIHQRASKFHRTPRR